MHSRPRHPGHLRFRRASPFLIVLLILIQITSARGFPHIPASDSEVLAVLPTGARHGDSSSRSLAATRLDIALPLARFEVSQARTTGDLRFLGYADAILAPWKRQPVVAPQVLVLDATILQSRHAFDASLVELDQALKIRPRDPQGWLIRATVLRVLGRYDEALGSCDHLASTVDATIMTLCRQSLLGLTGHLKDAYRTISSLPTQELPPEARAWRYSELGEMAERLGQDEDSEHWLREGLQIAPEDFYMRCAYADLLLRHSRATETLQLLSGYEAMEPMLLRVAIAHRLLHDGAGTRVEEQLSVAFEVEQQRGDAVHRREQARFLLDVNSQPAAALTVASENWQVQREPDDILILLRAAQAAHEEQAGEPALQFLNKTGLEDARLDSYRSAR